MTTSGTPLSSEEQALLNEVIAHRDPELQRLASDVVTGRRLTVPEANSLRDAIGDELAATGVDQEIGAVNERGRRLDDLIDRIAARSELHER